MPNRLLAADYVRWSNERYQPYQILPYMYRYRDACTGLIPYVF